MSARVLALASIGFGALSLAVPCGGGNLRVPSATVGDLSSSAKALDQASKKQKECEKLEKKKVAFEEERAIGGAVALSWIKTGGGLMLDVPPGAKLDQLKGASRVDVPKSEKNDLNRYLNYVGRNLAALSSRPTLQWTFGVLNADGPNAFSAPGGYVLITRGLLAKLENEAQLAGVLAHEIGHVTEAHALNVYTKVKANQCSTAVAGQLAGNMVDFNASLSSPLGYVDIDKMAGEAIAGLADKAVAAITESGFAEGDEYASDRIAMELTIAAGYSVEEYPKLLAKLPEGGGVFAHHPKNADRQAAIKRWFEGIKPEPNSFAYQDYPFKGYKPVDNKAELKLVKK